MQLPVGRIRAVYQHRSSLSDFGKSWFGKRACLHCFLEKDTLVLDSEWHWIFDCPKCNGIRAKHPYLRDSLESIRSNSEYAELNDLCKLLNAIQIDSRLGFSVVSFVRQAITLRAAEEKQIPNLAANGAHQTLDRHCYTWILQRWILQRWILHGPGNRRTCTKNHNDGRMLCGLFSKSSRGWQLPLSGHRYNPAGQNQGETCGKGFTSEQ